MNEVRDLARRASRSPVPLNESLNKDPSSCNLKNLGLQPVVEYVSARLDFCLAKHTQTCQSQSSTCLPTRVIDVGPSDGSRDPRLHITAEQGNKLGVENWKEDVRYIALSYCWGPAEKNLTTTLNNIANWKVQIQWAMLPQTIVDAIEITRALGIRYLWVDALCIIQGPGGDWSTEAEKMGSVYGGAFLTIAAAQGRDVSHGLCRRSNNHQFNSVYNLHRRQTPLGEEPLYSRAWALQERMLSPRVLIVGSSTLYWECLVSHHAEEGGYFPSLLRVRIKLKPSSSD